MDRNWISNQYPENVQKSALIRVSFSYSNRGAKLSSILEVSVEEMRYLFESSADPLPVPLAELETMMSNGRQQWYVPTFRRFAREIFEFSRPPLDPLLKIILVHEHPQKRGFLIPEFRNDALGRVMDFSYNDGCLYYFEKHEQWNQVFIPECVDTANPCIVWS